MKKDTIIQTSPGNYVDGFDGTAYEVTTDRKTAWRMHNAEALRRLPKVKEQFPEAKLVKV